MITRDLAGAVQRALDAAIRAGDLPEAPALPPGIWRPAPVGSGGGPGTYATTVPFLVAAATGDPPERVAAALASRLNEADGIERAAVTGRGYLTVTVTPDVLAWLAVRITQAGAACATSNVLRGTHFTAPRHTDLAASGTWAQAWQALADEITGRAADAAGATLTWAAEPPTRHLTPRAPRTPRTGPVADAIACAGEDAIRLALSRQASATSRQHPVEARNIDARNAAAQHLGNPAYAVRYAHAHATSAVRQAADLGFRAGDAGLFQPASLAHPSERALLDAMSWLPERVAGAARRREPHVLTAYLEDLAGTYFDCQECCPAAPPGLPVDADRGVTSARLWLAAAARTSLAAGLGLLGVAAPDRL